MMNDNGGGRPVLTVSKQMKTPADLKGLKIRSTASPVDQAIWRAWGAVRPRSILLEVYFALQSKVVDGYAPNWNDAVGSKQVELLKYAADVNYVVGVQVAGASRQVQRLGRRTPRYTMAAKPSCGGSRSMRKRSPPCRMSSRKSTTFRSTRL
jgi:hypothetical protein